MYLQRDKKPQEKNSMTWNLLNEQLKLTKALKLNESNKRKELSHDDCSAMQMIIDNETVFLLITPTGKEQMNEL